MKTDQLAAHGVPREVVSILDRRGIRELTAAQRRAVEAGVLAGKNVVVSAPTSAGKTLIGELVAAKTAATGLTVFLVSHKALARQVFDLVNRWYVDHAGTPFLKAGILTGDADTVRGDWGPFHFVVATYEKLYWNLGAQPATLRNLRVVVADELQTLGHENRGQVFELLLARLIGRTERRPQIVGLSATAPNSAVLAEWLDAEHIHVAERVPPLEQEIWLPGRRLVYREDVDEPDESRLPLGHLTAGNCARWLLDNGLGPVAVMATTKPRVDEYAAEIAAVSPVDHDLPESVIDEFRAHGDGEDTTDRCIEYLRRGVGVHYANLSPGQRDVVERAFRAQQLKVIVATPTIVAGVNLPIRTVVYPQVTRWSPQGDVEIPLDEYLNGAGRAGRLGLHDAGTVVMWSDSIAGARRLAARFVFGELPSVESRLEERSEGFLLLHILGILGKGQMADLATLASGTLWGHERKFATKAALRAGQAGRFSRVVDGEDLAECWLRDGDHISLSAIGYALVRTGMEPREPLEAYVEFKRFHAGACGIVELLCRMCLADCMADALPYSAKMRDRWASALRPVLEGHLPSGQFVTNRQIVMFGHLLLATKELELPDYPATPMRNHRAEREGACARLAHLLRGTCSLAEAENAAQYETTVERVRVLADQLDLKVSSVAVPIARVLTQNRVPHVGIGRITKLAEAVDGEVGRVLKLEDGQLAKAVGPKQVAGVREAVIDYLHGLTKERSARQLAESKSSPELHGVVEPVLRLSGERFETPAKALLNALGWNVDTVEQDGTEPRVDLEGVDDLGNAVLVECKTADDRAGEVSRSDALVASKKVPAGFDGYVYTLGRPTFADSGVEYALKTRDQWPHVRLVTAGALVELLLSVEIRGVPREVACDVLRRFFHVGVARVLEQERHRALNER